MEFEKRNTKNQKNPPPAEGSSTLPKAVLVILLGVIILLLFIGWQYLNDTPSNADEMIPTQPGVVSAQMDEEYAEETDPASADNTDELSRTLPDISLPSSGVVTDDEPEEPTPPPPPSVENKPEPIAPTSSGSYTYTHKVASGETFYSIAVRYNLSVDKLKESNLSVNPSDIKVGLTNIKVPVKAIHTVGPGDILRIVAKKYDITVQELMKANGKTKNFAQRGEKLVIPL
jgi:LysM repeat protein